MVTLSDQQSLLHLILPHQLQGAEVPQGGPLMAPKPSHSGPTWVIVELEAVGVTSLQGSLSLVTLTVLTYFPLRFGRDSGADPFDLFNEVMQ